MSISSTLNKFRGRVPTHHALNTFDEMNAKDAGTTSTRSHSLPAATESETSTSYDALSRSASTENDVMSSGISSRLPSYLMEDTDLQMWGQRSRSNSTHDMSELTASPEAVIFFNNDIAMELNHAAFNGDLAIFTKYETSAYMTRSVFAELISRGDYDKRTPLHIAAMQNHAHVVKYLVNKGANIHTSDRWGMTCLDMAVENDHHAIAAYLVRKGATGRYRKRSMAPDADADAGRRSPAPPSSSFTPASSSSSSFLQRQGAAVLKEQKDRLTAEMLSAASKGDIEQIKGLLLNGADINLADGRGRTALHLAASEGHMQMTDFLILLGADFEATDTWDQTPLTEVGSEM